MPQLRLEGVTKRFGNVVAVDDVTLEIEHGEVMSILGPSGCGKTTTLRLIAGFLKPDKGRILMGGSDVTGLPPEKRNVGMVFQNYALWPHMTVFDNIAFGLKIRKMPKEEIKRKVKEVLELVRLEGFESRYPPQLSGGQQQRIALARALALEPQVLLMDEPLSNLDAKLREEMRFEVRELQKKLSITTVYVTHDQAEALAISDRIAVMNRGKIVQVGSPSEIYDNPANQFVASFIGISNFIEGELEAVEGEYGVVRLENGERVTCRLSPNLLSEGRTSGKVLIVVRPENIELAKEGSENILETRVTRKIYLGNTVDYRVDLDGIELRLLLPPERDFKVGEKVRISLNPQKSVIIKG